jgi:hypothetical protein
LGGGGGSNIVSGLIYRPMDPFSLQKNQLIFICLLYRKYFNRNLRLYLLFVTVLTWYIFERFGGMAYRSDPPESAAANGTANQRSGDDDGSGGFCSGRLRSEGGRGFWFLVFLLQATCQARSIN